MTAKPPAPGLILAAPASGHGKTVATLAIIRALSRSGSRVAAAKAGPDYIDPAFHAAAGGEPCFNLDIWGMRRDTLAGLAGALSRAADLVVCEGVMGLFDGSIGGGGATADLAAATGWPVVLVVDVRGQGASVAALLRGFCAHRPDVPVAGAILNRIGGSVHGEILSEAIGSALPELPIVGYIPRSPKLALPERHLGLVQAVEHEEIDTFLDEAADIVAENVDLAALQALARPSALSADVPLPLAPLGQRIAIARDVAFAFAYPAILDGWRAAGAELSFFSPLADETPTPGADAIYLPGGYPELHAGRLAANASFLAGLRQAADHGAAIYGECGGYMVLGQGLEDSDGEKHQMAGLLPLATSFARPRLHLGYRHCLVVTDSPLAQAGAGFSGHEFHYATAVAEGPGRPLFALSDARGGGLGHAGLVEGRVSGSFVHLIDRTP